MTDVGEPPYRITLVLDGWIWSGDDLDKALADLRKLLESRQTPTTGAFVSLHELTITDRRREAWRAREEGGSPFEEPPLEEAERGMTEWRPRYPHRP